MEHSHRLHSFVVSIVDFATFCFQIIGYNEECIKLLAESMLAVVTPVKVSNAYLPSQPMKSPSSGDLLPYLPVYPFKGDIPDLQEGSVQIPTFLRYIQQYVNQYYSFNKFRFVLQKNNLSIHVLCARRCSWC